MSSGKIFYFIDVDAYTDQDSSFILASIKHKVK